MRRDFSDESKQKMLRLVAQVENEKWCIFTDWIGDRWYDFESWIGVLGINNYIDEVNEYHKLVIDKNNATEQTINSVFSTVSSVDREFACKLDQIRLALTKWNQYIERLSDIVNPAHGSFTTNFLDTELAELLESATRTSEDIAAMREDTLSNIDTFETQGDYDWKDIIGSFGNVGDMFGFLVGLVNATTWNERAAAGIKGWNTLAKIAKDYNNYTKLGRMIGTKKAMSYFWREQLGLNNIGHASTFKEPVARFYNNLHNSTSAFNLKQAFAPLTGKAGTGSAVAAWGGVILSGIGNAFENAEERDKSDGAMSNERVVAETVSETVIETVVTYGGTAVVGAAITTVTGVVAAPVLVAVVTGVALAGVNAGVKELTGQTATEWVSDTILNFGTAVGNAVVDGSKAVAGWFGKLSFM